MGKVEATYKARDVEEIIDIHLYRPWGYALAVAALRLHMTPNQVSVIGMAVGVVSGHFFFYQSLPLNLVGIFLWMLAQALDGADGQLARMADMRSQLGRMLDGISDNVKFTSLYLHLGARLALEFDSPWPIVVMFASGIAHSYQSALADYYRNAYLWFVYGAGRAELEDEEELRSQYRTLSWGRDPLMKFLSWGYLVYTRRQARWASGSLELIRDVSDRYGVALPDALRAMYRALNRPLLRYYNALTTNTRMVALYVAVFIGQVAWYFAFELVVLNLVMILLLVRWQPEAHARVREFMDARPAGASVP
jgi:hypothetical protein